MKLLQIVGHGRTSSSPMRLSVMRVVCVFVLGVLGIAACKAASGPKDATSKAAGQDGGGAPAPIVLFNEERESTGKLVAFKDEDDLKAFGASWREQQEGFHVPGFYKMAGPPDGGAPPPSTPSQPAKPKAPTGNSKGPSASPATPAAAAPPPPPAARAAPRPAATTAAPGRAAASKTESSSRGADAPAKASKDRDSNNFAGDNAESITNNQHSAVDEGDIVKLHGEHLVVLRRGRLFTITLEGDKIRQSAILDAFGPEIDPRGSWYDEMVVEGDHVVVVGFSYARGGTEIGLFRIDSMGQLTYRATYHLKSNDYYSARNYASRIVDGRLVFYAPLYINPNETDLSSHFPAVRKWSRNAKETDFVRTLVPSRLYHLEGETPASPTAALHTVTSCDLREPTFKCESIGIVGPPGRVFYVSPSGVYVWMQDFLRPRRNEMGAPQQQQEGRDGEKKRPNGLVARLPIGRIKGAAPTMVRVAGMPTDQFSFEEDESYLNVLVRSESNGDAMFASESTTGATALLRMPLNLFSDTVPAASSRRYRILPRPDGASVQNRFIGSWLLYGSGQGYVTEHHGRGQLYAVRYADSPQSSHPASASNEDRQQTDPNPPTTMDLDQGIDRIEAMGDDAVVVGSRNADLVFTPIELGESKEAHARRDFVRKNAAQGELRSHGFFYKPGKTPRDGVVGLPIVTDGEEGPRGAAHLLEGSAQVLFLSAHALEFSELGALRASRLTTNHDGCRASCVDWYGNARPIFAKGRIFALMGYEIVEGRVDDPQGRSAHMMERARLSFAPRGGPPATDDGY